MIIELDELFCHNIDKINIDDEFSIASTMYENTDIKGLNNLHFAGQIEEESDGNLSLKGVLSGVMIVEDAISLEEIPYEFSSEIEENLEEFIKNGQNTIDILDILWQNIVLEVPIRYTKVTDLKKFSGDGWKLIDEEDIKGNNPFIQLKEKMEEE